MLHVLKNKCSIDFSVLIDIKIFMLGSDGVNPNTSHHSLQNHLKDVG